MIYKEAVNYLESFIGKVIYKINPQFSKQHDPLERMRIFLSLLGDPQDKFKSILVGGTSGKGSTAYLISRILTTASYKTGFTLSPHLQKANERLQIKGKEISDEKFVSLLSLVMPAIEKMEKLKIGAPSYFEILVGMAFKYFTDQKVDIAIAEVGMGGEFDATNTLDPLIAVLTNVSLDHTQNLGRTIEKIAKTKVGIIKSGVVVSGVNQASVIKIVADHCKKMDAQLNLLWRDFGYKIKKEDVSGIDFDFISDAEILDDLKFSFRGQYQAENASLAIKAALELKKFGFKIPDEAIRKALKTAFFPGRFEVKELKIKNCKLKIILDGAHNPVKMKEFLKSLKKIFPKEKKTFIIGFKFDKDIKQMLKEILDVGDDIIITEFNGKTDIALHASAEAEEIKRQALKMKYEGKIITEKDPEKALKIAFKMKPEMIVATGSLYLIGEIRNKIALF